MCYHREFNHLSSTLINWNGSLVTNPINWIHFLPFTVGSDVVISRHPSSPCTSLIPLDGWLTAFPISAPSFNLSHGVFFEICVFLLQPVFRLSAVLWLHSRLWCLQPHISCYMWLWLKAELNLTFCSTKFSSDLFWWLQLNLTAITAGVSALRLWPGLSPVNYCK